MSEHRCGHFSLEYEGIPAPATEMPLYVPIRRCALAENMVSLLLGSEAGRAAAEKLMIASARKGLGSQKEERRQDIRVAFGPDLEAIHAEGCNEGRCQESCTPHYRRLLAEFGHDPERVIGPETSCEELTPLSEKREGN